MHYVTIEQEKWLIAHGMKPSCPEKGITLIEAAQWFWENYKLECSYNFNSEDIDGEFSYWEFDAEIEYSSDSDKLFKTIPEALSWAIDQAINHVNQQSNG